MLSGIAQLKVAHGGEGHGRILAAQHSWQVGADGDGPHWRGLRLDGEGPIQPAFSGGLKARRTGPM